MENFKIDIAKGEDINLYSFVKVLLLIGLSIIFFGVVIYLEKAININRIYINWSIYYFVGFIMMYIILTILELKEGAINGN